MYVGHLGVALGARAFRRTVPLWLLVFAAQIPDWMDVGVCSLGVDRGPAGLYTHGIPVLLCVSGGLALAYASVTRDVLGGLVVAAVVLSHYLLDFITGWKPTWADGPIIGLGFYSRPLIEFTLEMLTIGAGWWFYRRSLPADERQTWPVSAMFWVLVLFQIVGAIAFYLNMGGSGKC